jgi:hypothetical protein
MPVNVPMEKAAPDSALTVNISPESPLPLGSYHFRLQVEDYSHNVSVETTVRVIVVEGTTQTLSVTFTGTGGATVTSDPAGIICQAALPTHNCSFDFTTGSTVMLTATADGVSELTGWTNADTAKGNPVGVTMDGGKTVAAAFALIQYPVLIYGAKGYATLQEALAAVTQNCTIMIKESYGNGIPQALLFDKGYAISLTGGLDDNWTSVAGTFSIIKGHITVSSGTVTVQAVQIGP